jgi:hypothetical protein
MIRTIAVCEARAPFVHGDAGCERARSISSDDVVQRLIEAGSR